MESHDIGSEGLMAAKKKTAVAAKTSCEQFMEDNGEIISGFTVTITGKEIATLRVKACRGTVRILTFFQKDPRGAARRLPIADTPGITDEFVDISRQALSNVLPGQNYVLTWVVDSPVDDWQLVSEFSLDGTVHYRHLKKFRPGVLN